VFLLPSSLLVHELGRSGYALRKLDFQGEIYQGEAGTFLG
jgi:hypothetical protein